MQTLSFGQHDAQLVPHRGADTLLPRIPHPLLRLGLRFGLSFVAFAVFFPLSPHNLLHLTPGATTSTCSRPLALALPLPSPLFLLLTRIAASKSQLFDTSTGHWYGPGVPRFAFGGWGVFRGGKWEEWRS